MSRTKTSPARMHRLSRQSGAPVVPCYKMGAHGAWRGIPCRVPRKLPSLLEGPYAITRTSFMPEVFLKLRNFNKSTETYENDPRSNGPLESVAEAPRGYCDTTDGHIAALAMASWGTQPGSSPKGSSGREAGPRGAGILGHPIGEFRKIFRI